MGFIVYVTHPSEESVARSVCLKKNSGVVLSLDNTLPRGKVEETVNSSPIQQEEILSYDQVLTLLLKADKVFTL